MMFSRICLLVKLHQLNLHKTISSFKARNSVEDEIPSITNVLMVTKIGVRKHLDNSKVIYRGVKKRKSFGFYVHTQLR